MLQYIFSHAALAKERYSTQKILHNARLAESGVIPRDAVKESLSLELDMINILSVILYELSRLKLTSISSIRLVQILTMQNRKK